MVECPKCKALVVWDWEQDVYRYKATGAEITVQQLFGDSPDNRARIFICECGTILGVAVLSDSGEYVYSHEAWRGVDWQTNSWRLV